ncbi:MAG: efflux transporter outer membrane subunit [Legionellaceae bacterium]|nr:efflux transporter outer membrane subunit [Legionellaceae bacterium]
MKPRGLIYFITPFFLFLSACMVGPNYKEPTKKVASHWIKKDKYIKESSFRNANWWKVFNDPTLTALIYQGYQHNLSLHRAAVHVLRTRAQLAQSVGQFFPQQQLMTGNLTYQRIGGQSLEFVLPSSFNTALMGFSASWELDFWGKYRRAILSRDASFYASYAAYDNALVTLTSDIASTYIAIRTTERLIEVTKKNIKVQAYSLKLAAARHRAGETSLLDVEQAQTVLSQTQSNLPPLASNLQQQKDMLGVLLGTTPDQVDCFLTGKHGAIPKAPSSVAVGIPKETLMKRPDIYQSRMEVIAQSERIGAIKANLYPAISLTGTFAFAANDIGQSSLSDLFSWSNRTISAGPSFNWPLLNYGQITNAVREQDAVFQEALLNYLDLTLKAQQEVQDNITQFIEMKKSEGYLITANGAATKATKLSLVRYKEGQSDFTPVLNSETQQLKVETSLATAQGDVPKALVALYRSLGGGWQIRGCNDIVPRQIEKEMAKRTNWGTLLQQKNHQPPNTGQQRIEELYLPNW